MHSIDTEFKAERMTIRAHVGSALLTAVVLLTIASTGARLSSLQPRENKERAIYYLAPPQELVDTSSAAPKSPASIETFSVDLRELRDSVELSIEAIDVAFNPDVSSDAFLDFGMYRQFRAAAPSIDDIEPFLIFDASEVDERPEIRYAKRPEVPLSLRGEEVELIVFYYVNRSGRTERQSVLSSSSENAAYAEAAKSAIGDWRFKPARKNGKPVACWVQQTIRFNASSFSPFAL